jgi:poly(3-hydroxybutyrate) depolymerase
MLSLGALSRSPGLASIRTVDALLLFASGMSAGAALSMFLASRKAAVVIPPSA